MESVSPGLDDLLEREDPQTSFPEDARHWIAIYREMIAFNRSLLERSARIVPWSSPGRPRPLSTTAVGGLEDQLKRFEQRLEFWYERQWALEGLMLDRATRTVTFRDRSVRLTRREFQLLETLARRAPSHLGAQQLLVEAWQDSRLPEETLRAYIVRLRSKLDELEAGVAIVNRPRYGYALVFPRRDGSLSLRRNG